MFDFIRNHTKIFGGVLFILVVPAFVLVSGVGDYLGMGGEARATVAKVDGQKITQAEWDDAHHRASDQLRSQQPDIDPKLLDSPQARYNTLEQIVRQRVIARAAADLKLFTSDQALARALLADPAIAALRGADGKLDTARYSALLKGQGLTPESYEAMVRSQLSQEQVLGGVLQSGGVRSQTVQALVTTPLFEQRNVQVLNFAPSAYMPTQTPDTAQLKAYYDSHLEQFKTTEQIDVEYIVLDLPALERTITLPEQDVKTYYEQNQSRYSGKNERRASHILITADTPEAGRAKAQEILAQLRQNPARFAELARQHSKDPGSAAQGGDLGFFEHKVMTKPFADAVFAMQEGQISDVVASDFGFHIIQLTGIRNSQNQSFEAARPQILAELRRQQASQLMAAKAEELREETFKRVDDLQAVASKLGLPLQRASNISRTPTAGSTDIVANRHLLHALFAPESLAKKQNIQPVETAPNQLVAARVVDYRPAQVKPFDAITAEVAAAWKLDQAAQAARQAGQARLKELQKTPTATASWQPETTVSRIQPAGLPEAVLQAAMRQDKSKLPAVAGVDLGTQGYAIVRVNSIAPADALSTALAQQLTPQLNDTIAQAQAQAYYEYLKQRLKAVILVPRPAAESTVSNSAP